MASDDLRARLAAVLARHEPVPGMWDCTCGARVDTFEQHRAVVVLAVVQPELDRERELSQSLFEQRKQMAAERFIWQERGDRYRLAWQSARQRAQAYGEGILRHVADRDAYKGWMEEQGERANRAEQELATVRTALETLTAQSATALAKRDKAKQRARIAEAELETLRGGLREIGGDPTQVQNLYAQLASRTQQWKELQATQVVNDDAWGSVWLHGKWSWLTKNMTTEQREHAADCVARWSARLAEIDGDLERGEPEGLRWWRELGDSCSTCGGVDPTRCDCMRPERN